MAWPRIAGRGTRMASAFLLAGREVGNLESMGGCWLTAQVCLKMVGESLPRIASDRESGTPGPARNSRLEIVLLRYHLRIGIASRGGACSRF
jgi:hypothetical protein